MTPSKDQSAAVAAQQIPPTPPPVVPVPAAAGGGDAPPDLPPEVQGALALARQTAAEAEQKRLRGDLITAAYRFEAAVAAIPPALVADPASAAGALLNWCQAHRAASLGALGLVDSAHPLFKEVLERNPQYGWALAQYAEMLRLDLRDRLSADPNNKARFDEGATEALRAFSEAIRLKPNYAWGYAHRGALVLLIYWYYTTHNLPLAQLPEPLLGMGMVNTGDATAGFAKQIQDDLEMALKIEPSYAWATLFQALFQNLFDQDDDSRNTLTSMLALGGGTNITVLTSLAMSHIYAGDVESARGFADQILRVDGENVHGQYVRAKVLQGNGGEIERQVFESFKTRLQVAKDRIDALLEDLNDSPVRRADLLTRQGQSLDNLAIRARLQGVRKLAKADKNSRNWAKGDRAWAKQSKDSAEFSE